MPVIHHLALRTTDPEASAAFYKGVLGLPELRRFAEPDGIRSIWLDAGGAVLMLERDLRGSGPGSGSGHVLALSVADLADWAKRLAAAGVPIDDRTAHTLYVHDPDGHRVGLSTYPL